MRDTEMKDNEIVEILEDGTIYYFDLDVCNDEADKLLTELYGKEGKVSNFDFTASIFNLFVNSIHNVAYIMCILWLLR